MKFWYKPPEAVNFNIAVKLMNNFKHTHLEQIKDVLKSLPYAV